MKPGVPGRLMDALIGRRKADEGIEPFIRRLEGAAEAETG
jgi:hypothetical protein